jgi:hypothetical protein
VLRLAFAGTFAARLEPQVRAHLAVPCDVVVADEASENVRRVARGERPLNLVAAAG